MLARLVLRLLAVEALKGKTLAGDNVYDTLTLTHDLLSASVESTMRVLQSEARRLGLAGRVTFTGVIHRDQVPATWPPSTWPCNPPSPPTPRP